MPTAKQLVAMAIRWGRVGAAPIQTLGGYLGLL